MSTDPLTVLAWHVHGAWSTSLVQGRHRYLVPFEPARGPDGRGRAETYGWPDSAVEVLADPSAAGAGDPLAGPLTGADGRPVTALDPGAVDVVVLQRPHEIALLERLTGLRAGIDVPAVYVEHNTPRGDVPDVRHPLADRGDIPVVHVTSHNALLWDSGAAPVRVVDHGVPTPRARWGGPTGAQAGRAVVVVNEPVRRGRVVGTDLLPALARAVDLDVFGMGVEGLAPLLPPGPGGPVRLAGDVPQARMHAEVAAHGVYVHPCRWTSLGLSLLEAMAMGMPVVALAATAAPEAVAPGCGLLARSGAELAAGAAGLLADPVRAGELGAAAAERAATRYGLGRFLDEFDEVLAEVTGPARVGGHGRPAPLGAGGPGAREAGRPPGDPPGARAAAPPTTEEDE